jgi:glycosyltransferase involved in cell wall biosynthesis
LIGCLTRADTWEIFTVDVSTLQTPLVSVVIPTFNGASVIWETLESVRSQTFQNFEAIIVDDGSTDDTSAIARRFCETDSRFAFVQQIHAGVSNARNAGILQARGEWIALLDHDDIWLPQKLERQLALSREDSRANFLFTNFYLWDGQRDLRLMYPDGQPLPEGDTLRQLVFSFTYLPSTVMVRRQTLLDAHLFDPELLMSQDWDMWLRIAEHGIWARGIREPLVRYRRWPGSLIGANRLASSEDNVLAIKKRLRATQHASLIPLYRRSLAAVQIHCERMRARHLVETDPDALPRFIWRVWHLDPRSKWLRWYLCLVWPKFLGGNMTRRYVHHKIRSQWPDPNN